MRVFLLFGCLVICVNGHIEIQVVQNVCMGGKCDSGENGNETPPPVTTTASLTQLNAELAQLMQQGAQAAASSNAVQSAADAASSMVESASPSSLTGRRHRRNVIDLPPCGTGGPLVGDGATVVTAILNGIMGELSTISTTLDPTVLNCYASRALNVTSAFNDGLLPKIADMTAIIALAASVNSSVATASNALAAKINELQIQIKAKQDEIAAAQPTTAARLPIAGQTIEYGLNDTLAMADLQSIPRCGNIWPFHCKYCCYGNRYYFSGQLIANFPMKCMSLYCWAGTIWPYYHGSPNNCGCCMFNGVMYQNGQSLPGICIRLTCKNGQWVTTGHFSWKCGICEVWNDPFFLTFDGVYYAWHGRCRYAISQKGFGYSAPFGIYGQFNTCPGLWPSTCLEITTFEDILGTEITIEHVTPGMPVKVNGIPQTITATIQALPSTSVLAWKVSPTCYMFLGTHGFLLQTCPNDIYVWAINGLMNQVNGLCGHFNGVVSDDFTDRWTTQWPTVTHPFVFPYFWMTTAQPKRCLIKWPIDDSIETLRSSGNASELVKNSSIPEIAVDPCQLTVDEVQQLRAECSNLLSKVQWNGTTASGSTLEVSISSCASTLCILDQNNATDDVVQQWKRTMQNILESKLNIEVMTISDAVTPLTKDINDENQ